MSEVERVLSEVHILKLIKHPNIIQLYEINETPKQLYLIIEYANEGELYDYIVKKTWIDVVKFCNCFQQIISWYKFLISY